MKRYLVWCPEYGQTKDDARHIEAVDARAAACKWAMKQDAENSDYLILRGGSVTVLVAEVGRPERQVSFIASGECVPRYSARPIVQP